MQTFYDMTFRSIQLKSEKFVLWIQRMFVDLIPSENILLLKTLQKMNEAASNFHPIPPSFHPKKHDDTDVDGCVGGEVTMIFIPIHRFVDHHRDEDH